MPNNYDFLDAYGSILTARSSITSGSAQEPIIQISSFLSAVPTQASGNQSVSGTINIGNAPSVYGNISGSVVSFQGTSPWNISSVYGNVSGSVLSQQLGTRISSVVSSNPSSLLAGASIFGQLPGGTAMLGSVAALQGNAIWNIAGSVVAFQGGSWTPSVSGTVGASIIGLPPVKGSTAEDSAHSTGDPGHFVLGVRNDAVASFVSANLDYTPIGLDSAGRVVSKLFAPEESRVEGYSSTVNVSVTTLVAAAGAGLRNYITDIFIANTGAAATLVTFKSGGGSSILGYTIAPAGSGSNMPGIATPFRTLANETFDFQATTGTSVLYATVKGFKAP